MNATIAAAAANVKIEQQIYQWIFSVHFSFYLQVLQHIIMLLNALAKPFYL